MWVRTQCKRRLMDCHDLSIEKFLALNLTDKFVRSDYDLKVLER